MLAMSAAATAGQCICRSIAQASAAPTVTGVIDRPSVRGRAAMSQDESFITKCRF